MSDTGLFAGTGPFYAQFRPGYPKEFLDDLVQHFTLDGSGRLLDLGCGTGQLTIPLAEHVAEAVGIDPEPDMLAEATREARAKAIGNVTFVRGSSANLPSNLGRFHLVTMGRSFHWMDRDQVLRALANMVEDDGGLVIANDSCLARPITPWQHAIEAVQHRFLGPLPQSGATLPPEPHETTLARSPFPTFTSLVYKFERSWTTERIIGYLYSTSLPLRQLLGNRRPAFEQEVTNALLAANPTGHFIEPVVLQVLLARKTLPGPAT
ncbi:class I SAM-dependent methyltransferase [Nonomuraea sp. NPDC050404]|uniref:class I SAM-dependent methyltransferase n=1 Tax=Nonomuraea sp. NPDC050404 TaxID=3155783 RepID=UPI00340E940C